MLVFKILSLIQLTQTVCDLCRTVSQQKCARYIKCRLKCLQSELKRVS